MSSSPNLLAYYADRICSLILFSDLPKVDVEIEIEKLRQMCLDSFPDKKELFRMLYESRFERLWQQWRQSDEDSF